MLDPGVVRPMSGLLRFGIFLSNFGETTAKTTTKAGNVPNCYVFFEKLNVTVRDPALYMMEITVNKIRKCLYFTINCLLQNHNIVH